MPLFREQRNIRMKLKGERKYQYYICGQCKTPIEFLPNENPPIPCPDCGWQHGERPKRVLPDEIKYPIN